MLTVRDSSSRLREVGCIEFTVLYTPHDVDSHIPREFHQSLAVSPPHNPSDDNFAIKSEVMEKLSTMLLVGLNTT